MAVRITQNSIYELKGKITAYKDCNTPITITTQYNVWAQYIIKQFLCDGIPYKLINNGAGVKTITTETEVCPCCRRKL